MLVSVGSSVSLVDSRFTELDAEGFEEPKSLGMKEPPRTNANPMTCSLTVLSPLSFLFLSQHGSDNLIASPGSFPLPLSILFL